MLSAIRKFLRGREFQLSYEHKRILTAVKVNTLQDNTAWNTHPRLARQLGMKPMRVVKLVDELEKHGYLSNPNKENLPQ